MTDAKKQEIERLRATSKRADKLHRMLLMQNLETDPDEREKQYVIRSLATNAMHEAEVALDAAISLSTGSVESTSGVSEVRSLKEIRLVLVEWLDSHYVPGWHTDAPAEKPSLCRSVGWLICDGEQAKVISPHVINGDPPQRNGEMTIPACAIVSMVEIKPERSTVVEYRQTSPWVEKL